MENIKVFELAKKMGIETIALMDKLREFKIPVKSHMAELDPETQEQIQAKFDEEKKVKAPAKGAKGTRTKKAATAAATPKVVKASQVNTSAAAAKKAPAKAAVAPKATAAKVSPSSAKAAAARTVIRRKANAQEEAAAAAAQESEGEYIDSAEEGLSSAPSAPTEQYSQIISTPPRPVPTPQVVAGTAAPAQSAAAGTEVVTSDPKPIAAVNEASRLADRQEARRPGMAQVISRIDLRETMGVSERAIRPGPNSRNIPGRTPPPSAQGVKPAATTERNESGSHEPGEENKFDREAIGKLIKAEALAQAKKAAAHLRETKVENFNSADFKKRELLFQPKKKKTLVGRAAQKTQITTPGAHKRKIRIEGGITVSQLAQEMGVKTNLVLKKLIGMGSMVTVNDTLDFDTAQILAGDYNFEVENTLLSDQEMIKRANEDVETSGEMLPRPPVVTVMGHVDHGKTSLLDVIRKANVASGEAGGITQHIGAYSVLVNGKKITFLDTPGHEAFTAMRARGAKVTDIVILVVAADDGIMPQTREAIMHAKSAGVPIIVAVNKMDLPQANPQKVLQGLTEFELVPEEWGGTTIVAKVSAAKKEGITELLEMVLLQAEVLDLKADANRPAAGIVIEARLDRGRGPVATILVQQGTARTGEILVAGSSSGRIRAMVNDKGQQIKEAIPGDPVEVLGLDSVPLAGDVFDIVHDDEVAKDLVEKRTQAKKNTPAGPLKMSLEDLFAKVQKNDVKELAILVKADVQGSAEALKEMLAKVPVDQVRIKILGSSVGGITESDVLLASASKAIIIGFNVRPETGAMATAQREGVEIKTYTIIYDIVDDIKKAMTGLLAPTFVEKALGRAEVRSLFSVPKIGVVAGCSVTDGKITRSAQVRLLRDSRVIYDGKLASLKRFKDDVKEVQSGYECGLGIENYNDLKVGDVVEAYVKEQVASLLN